MVKAELDLIRRYIPDLKIRYYTLLGRLDRFILVNFNYERSSLLRRGIVNCIDFLDYILLSLPLVTALAGTCGMYGRPVKGKAESPAQQHAAG